MVPSVIMFIIAAIAAMSGISSRYLPDVKANNKSSEVVIKEAADVDANLSPEAKKGFFNK